MVNLREEEVEEAVEGLGIVNRCSHYNGHNVNVPPAPPGMGGGGGGGGGGGAGMLPSVCGVFGAFSGEVVSKPRCVMLRDHQVDLFLEIGGSANVVWYARCCECCAKGQLEASRSVLAVRHCPRAQDKHQPHPTNLQRGAAVSDIRGLG
jgi:hypothetical protein